jgi:hypothetical protein
MVSSYIAKPDPVGHCSVVWLCPGEISFSLNDPFSCAQFGAMWS